MNLTQILIILNIFGALANVYCLVFLSAGFANIISLTLGLAAIAMGFLVESLNND